MTYIPVSKGKFDRHWLKVSEACQLLGISTVSGYRFIRTGKLRAYVLNTRCYRVDYKDVENFLKLKRTSPAKGKSTLASPAESADRLR